ncbi:MAG TPA: hypothetical protein VFI95_21720 [Terriglobales bacterium]|nr:hypothetical protein [Terriglobales bacterium]
MSTQATHADAELILKLYDLRREPEIRKARNFLLTAFWPESADDIVNLARAFPSQENAWFRQVGGYWDMAASLVLHGAINEELFLEPGCSGEMFFLFAKIQPYLKEVREKMNSPQAFANIEKLATKTEQGRERLKALQALQADFRKRRAEVAKAS